MKSEVWDDSDSVLESIQASPDIVPLSKELPALSGIPRRIDIRQTSLDLDFHDCPGIYQDISCRRSRLSGLSKQITGPSLI
jgi:hypothetical protein